MFIPNGVEGFRFDLRHLDAPGCQHFPDAGPLLHLLFLLTEAEFPLLPLLSFPGALAQQNPQHAVGVTVTCHLKIQPSHYAQFPTQHSVRNKQIKEQHCDHTCLIVIVPAMEGQFTSFILSEILVLCFLLNFIF